MSVIQSNLQLTATFSCQKIITQLTSLVWHKFAQFHINMIKLFLNADINQDDVFVKTYDQNQVHEMMLDPLLYKGVKLSEVNPTAAIQTAWSPPGVADVGYVGYFYWSNNLANWIATAGAHLQ